MWVDVIHTTGCCRCPEGIVCDKVIANSVPFSLRHDALHLGFGGPQPCFAVLGRSPYATRTPRVGCLQLLIEHIRSYPPQLLGKDSVSWSTLTGITLQSESLDSYCKKSTVTSTNEGGWVAERRKWYLLHDSSNWALYTPTLWPTAFSFHVLLHEMYIMLNTICLT
jgi:hypothetical protein